LRWWGTGILPSLALSAAVPLFLIAEGIIFRDHVESAQSVYPPFVNTYAAFFLTCSNPCLHNSSSACPVAEAGRLLHTEVINVRIGIQDTLNLPATFLEALLALSSDMLWLESLWEAPHFYLAISGKIFEMDHHWSIDLSFVIENIDIIRK
jgi:hypothetical protein